MAEDLSVTRLNKIGERLGIGKTAVAELIKAGEIEVFPILPGGRAKVALNTKLDAYVARRAAKAAEPKKRR